MRASQLEANIAEETQTERESAAQKGATEGVRSGKSFPWSWVVPLLICLIAAGIYLAQRPPTPLKEAEALIKANRPAAALPILENLAKTSPEDHSYLPWLAQCYLNTDRLAEGRTALDTAIRVKLAATTLTPVVKNFSKYYRQKNDFAEAERLLTSAQTACPASEFQEERKEIHREWAEADAAKNKINEAIQHLETAASFENPVNAQTAHRMAELYRQQSAIEEMQNGNDKSAIALLQKSLAIADEPASRLALANLYTKNNDLPNAIINLRAVCHADPNNLEARHRLVEASIKTEDYSGAQEAASELAERERSIENYESLSILCLKLGNYAGAVRALEEATSLSPKDLKIMAKLESAMKSWSQDLGKSGKMEDAQSVKVRADRVAEMIKAIEKEQNPEAATPIASAPIDSSGQPPLTLTASRIWLSKGSLTPEGEIKVKNYSELPVNDLSLTVAFFDNTWKRRTGSVTVSAASESHPMLAGQTRSLYFSSPNIVRAEHQLSVLIYWKGKLIRELPVVKER